MTTGYSGTPLAQRLGLKPGMRAWFQGMPDSVRAEIDAEALVVEEESVATDGVQCAHLFTTDRAKLERELGSLRHLVAPNGFIWVSWPKQSAGIASEVDENAIRDVALPLGLVDIKVCAVDEIWSGLKLVIRKELR